MRKLIFVNRYFYPDHSATSQMLSDLAFALAEGGGDEVHVVASRQAYDNPKASLAAFEQIQGVRVHRVWTSRFGRQNLAGRAFDYLSFYLTAFAKLLALAGRGDTVIAKTDPPLISVVAALAARVKSAELVNWAQDLFPEVAAALGVKLASGPAYRLLRRLRDYSLRAARANIAIGERMRERLLAAGVPAGRVHVIHNWADAEQIQPIAPADNPLRHAWGLDGKFVVGYSGNLGRGHDYATLLDAATALRGQPDIAFLIIGGGAKLDALKQAAAERALDNFVFQPYQPRASLSASLSAADVHIVSLKPELEGLIVPSKFYGIAAAGRPVLFIGDPSGEIPCLIAEIGCGHAVAEGQAEVLRDKILALSTQEDVRLAMGNTGRASLVSTYGRQAALARWRTILNLSQ
ncbi:MAG: glycosyltransferase family 4 protein [Candidatus Methylumidiphilus sp.]